MGNSEDWAQMLMLQLWPYQAARADTAGETLGSSVLRGGGAGRGKRNRVTAPLRLLKEARSSAGPHRAVSIWQVTCLPPVLKASFL